MNNRPNPSASAANQYRGIDSAAKLMRESPPTTPARASQSSGRPLASIGLLAPIGAASARPPGPAQFDRPSPSVGVTHWITRLTLKRGAIGASDRPTRIPLGGRWTCQTRSRVVRKKILVRRRCSAPRAASRPIGRGAAATIRSCGFWVFVRARDPARRREAQS
jgi:hypothetical protein